MSVVIKDMEMPANCYECDIVYNGACGISKGICGWSIRPSHCPLIPVPSYEELLKAAKAMHTWIFLNSYDEQEAYDECELSDEMNAVLGYAGSFILADKEGAE